MAKINYMKLLHASTGTDVLANGLTVQRITDGVLGTIERFGHRFGTGDKAYNAYWVRWSDGKLGYPNESDFTICKKHI